MKVSAQLLSSSLSGCGRKLVGFALKVQVSGDLWSPAVVLNSMPGSNETIDWGEAQQHAQEQELGRETDNGEPQ